MIFRRIIIKSENVHTRIIMIYIILHESFLNNGDITYLRFNDTL